MGMGTSSLQLKAFGLVELCQTIKTAVTLERDSPKVEFDIIDANETGSVILKRKSW